MVKLLNLLRVVIHVYVIGFLFTNTKPNIFKIRLFSSIMVRGKFVTTEFSILIIYVGFKFTSLTSACSVRLLDIFKQIFLTNGSNHAFFVKQVT